MMEEYEIKITPIDDSITVPIFADSILGTIETVSTVPTAEPRSFSEQIKFYSNGAVYRIYIYDTTNRVWRYAILI